MMEKFNLIPIHKPWWFSIPLLSTHLLTKRTREKKDGDFQFNSIQIQFIGHLGVYSSAFFHSSKMGILMIFLGVHPAKNDVVIFLCSPNNYSVKCLILPSTMDGSSSFGQALF
ncbi:hypothetical protein BT93_B0890 [Corymbia citriodora subsp. variegata]|nr:hypothetical protein BT93_B0890 [Corymbia citriodora subsp. variegata]